MLTIEQVDTQSRSQVRRFVDLPYRLYATCSQWVPPLLADAELYLNREEHPFYEHSEADFFIAVRNGRDVGRVAVLEHRPSNHHSRIREARFYLFDCEDDSDAAMALFEQVFEWAQKRGLKQIIGPEGFSMLDASGILVEGFEYPQVMNMTNYNYDYYAKLIERVGFEKEDDDLSYQLDIGSYHLPTWVCDIADWVQQKGDLHIQCFSTMEEFVDWIPILFETYQKSIGRYNPSLSGSERVVMIETLKRRITPELIKTIRHGKKIVGFIFGLPNLSTALQRGQGLEIHDLQWEMQHTKEIVIYALGILPEFHLQGINALLAAEMHKTAREAGYRYVDLLRIADSTVPMQRDLKAIGIQPIRRHRVYVRQL